MIHKPSVERVKTPASGLGFFCIFQAMVEEAEEEGRDIAQVCMPYVEEDDEFVEGTWVPELWLVVRKVLSDDKS